MGAQFPIPAALSICQPSGRCAKVAFINVGRQHSVPTEDSLSRRHYPRHLRAIGFHGAHPCAPPFGRPAAFVPRPRANLTRFHGVFAPNSKHRALVTPSKRGKRAKRRINGDERTPVEQHAAMTCTRGHKGTTPQASIQYRYYNLRRIRRRCQGNRRYVGPQYRRSCGDQADTGTPSEKSGIKSIQPTAREQGAATNRFVRVGDEISLAERTHSIAASKISGR